MRKHYISSFIYFLSWTSCFKTLCSRNLIFVIKSNSVKYNRYILNRNLFIRNSLSSWNVSSALISAFAMISKTVSLIKRCWQELDIMNRKANSRIVCNYSVLYGALQINVTDRICFRYNLCSTLASYLLSVGEILNHLRYWSVRLLPYVIEI